MPNSEIVNSEFEKDDTIDSICFSDLFRMVENESDKNDENDPEIDYPPYVDMTFHRSQLVLLKQWIGSFDREKSVEHLPEESRLMITHSIQDFYKDLCKALERKKRVRIVPNQYSTLTEEEEKLLAECFED